MPSHDDLKVASLGECTIPSPLNLSTIPGDEIADYVPEDAQVLLTCEKRRGEAIDVSLAFEKAGPRETLFFRPSETRAAIVTCGGLCPGLNHVIRSLVLQLHHNYGVKDILGYRYGYHGLNEASGFPAVRLGPNEVRSIHRTGGSSLGVSRGAEEVGVMVDRLVRDDVHILFAIGGDGTLRGAHAIHQELVRRGKRIAIVGVPKTVDNDIAYVDKTFGFDTAVEVAKSALDGAHTEAVSAHNGIGLVKVMGRDAGFIAAMATLASLEVNYCLVPEVHFDLDGPQGLMASLERRILERGHALLVVAEGCASMLRSRERMQKDASGNVQYGADLDVGLYLKEELTKHFKAAKIPATVKYIDPSYMIRSVPANANDSIFCDILARHAAHAGMAGKTDCLIGRWNNIFIHVPIPLAVGQRKTIDPDSGLWLAVTETTGQPELSNTPASKRAAEWRRAHGAT